MLQIEELTGDVDVGGERRTRSNRRAGTLEPMRRSLRDDSKVHVRVVDPRLPPTPVKPTAGASSSKVQVRLTDPRRSG